MCVCCSAPSKVAPKKKGGSGGVTAFMKSLWSGSKEKGHADDEEEDAEEETATHALDLVVRAEAYQSCKVLFRFADFVSQQSSSSIHPFVSPSVHLSSH